MDRDVIGGIIGGVVWLAGTLGSLVWLTGCSGMELRAAAGIHRVDESAYSQRTYREAVPPICYLLPSHCAPKADEDVK